MSVDTFFGKIAIITVTNYPNGKFDCTYFLFEVPMMITGCVSIWSRKMCLKSDQVLVSPGACNRPDAIQCVANMEKRRCLLRRGGSNSKVKILTGFYICGVYCASPLRGKGIAREMMLRILAGFLSANGERQKQASPKIDKNVYERFLETFVLRWIMSYSPDRNPIAKAPAFSAQPIRHFMTTLSIRSLLQGYAT